MDESQSESRNTPESPSPDASAAGSSAGSSTAPDPFVADPGPPFDPEAAAREPAPEDAEVRHLEALEDPEPWHEESVRSLLVAQGQVAHGLIGVAEADWVYTQGDLAAIAPPLTRILNRYPATRAAGGTSDELGLMLGLGGYVTRSYRDRRDALRAIEEVEEVPITGEPAPEGTGPPTPEGDAAWKI